MSSPIFSTNKPNSSPLWHADTNTDTTKNSEEFFQRSEKVLEYSSVPETQRGYTTGVHKLLNVYYSNTDVLNTVILKDMLALANFEKSGIPSYFQMLCELSAKVNTIYRGINIYLTALCSWFDGYMYYPPNGFIKISDSHAFQLLVETHGREKSFEKMKVRAKVLTFLSGCDMRIQCLIQKSIIVHYAIYRKNFTVFKTYFDEDVKVSLKILFH